ncbi:MAG: hypothetical protein HYY84_15025 [Deltaproteobacteria bacterium]|nr:hypothetical protein [Deltaproteobacteria bacterium]
MSERRVIDGEVYDAKKRAREIVEAAEKAREVAKAEGYAAGIERARDEVAAQIASLVREGDTLSAALSEATAEVAIEVARRVVRHELTESRETVAALVAELMVDVRRREGVEIRVHPADGEAARNAAQGCRVVEDASIERGGCVVTGRTFRADARVETQLARLAEAVRRGR